MKDDFVGNEPFVEDCSEDASENRQERTIDHPYLRSKYMDLQVVCDMDQDPDEAMDVYLVSENLDDSGNGVYNGYVPFADIVVFHSGNPADGVNGLTNEVLLLMIRDRLERWQKGEHSSRENAIVLTKIEEILMWMNKRTAEREERGVEGTQEK